MRRKNSGASAEEMKDEKVTLISEAPLTKLGSMYSNTDRFIFREFCCPGCATLLCVEMTLKDLPYIWDTQLVS